MERPIFGKIRFMSTANTARKFAMTQYWSALVWRTVEVVDKSFHIM